MDLGNRRRTSTRSSAATKENDFLPHKRNGSTLAVCALRKHRLEGVCGYCCLQRRELFSFFALEKLHDIPISIELLAI